MVTSLGRECSDTGKYSSLTTADQFLTVIVVHESRHLMNVWKMSQQSDEPFRAFAARVTNTANMCAMSIKYPNPASTKDVVYRDHVVHQMIIHCMY